MARARGFTLSWASRRTEPRSSSSSSGRSKCTGEGYRTVRPGIFWSLTPDRPEMPEPPDPDQVPSESARSRADLQAELRKTRHKEQKQRHRWRRRLLYALSFIVLLAAVG